MIKYLYTTASTALCPIIGSDPCCKDTFIPQCIGEGFTVSVDTTTQLNGSNMAYVFLLKDSVTGKTEAAVGDAKNNQQNIMKGDFGCSKIFI